MKDKENTKPNNLSECFEYLDKMLDNSEDIEWFKTTSEDDAVIQSHHGLGRWMRNNWELWVEESNLHQYFRKLGLHHADDMSSVILTSYHRKLNDRELALDSQIKEYIEFWKENGNSE